MLPIETPNPLFGKYIYPTAKLIMEKQQDKTWSAKEIAVDKDADDYKQRLNPIQLNGVKLTLQIFVEIEQLVGDIWKTIGTWYPHSEIEGCALELARMETSVHAFFYQKMSDVLNIPPEETKENQEKIKVIADKLQLLQFITSNPSDNKLLTLATLLGIEQVFLFSNFAFLKSFKANGNKFIMNTLFGVDYVINDEQLHGTFAAYLHNTHLEELLKENPDFNLEKHHSRIKTIYQEIIRTEDAMIDYLFSGDLPINGITGSQAKIFIRSRANEALGEIGIDPIYEIEDNPIADWFYKGTKSIKLHDFFVAGTTQYSKEWVISKFSALPFIKGKTNE